MPEAADHISPSAVATWRSIDELAELVGVYCWLEHRIFELTGAWASGPEGGGPPLGPEAERRVWCAAASRRHGALAGRWADHLPVRAGVDPAALVTAPVGPLAAAIEELAASDPTDAFGVLVETFLPWVGGVYASHQGRASVVREAPVLEVLVEARRAAAAEARSGRSLLGRLAEGRKPSRHLEECLKRAFTGSRVFPAVRPS